MQLVFEMCAGSRGDPASFKTFDGTGGVIGRGATCDWIIADPLRLVSSHHGLVTYRNGQYFLTDISSNGIGVSGGAERLHRGQARLICEGDVYQLGSVEIRARLKRQAYPGTQPDAMIPDDAFLGLDPLCTLDLEHQRSEASAELDALAVATLAPDQSIGHGSVEADHLVLPQWAEPGPEPVAKAIPVTQDEFWGRFSAALGMPLDALDLHGREELAIKVAGLFRQTTEGLRQTLRTRDELNDELNPGWASPVPRNRNPITHGTDSHATVAALLGDAEPGALPAEAAVADACRAIQVHQLALVTACRTAVRGALAAFAPGHLLLCFEREGKTPRLVTDGTHWRAYQRHYQRQVDNDHLVGQLLRQDFCAAYSQQLRLVCTLHTTYPG
ncbi:type VI secretion system-associated FHA domain protein TagH [Pseudomonas kairouanensis]|uniref:Type VI secretion system-associated FHA domain protein TagH n=1 Tax=Pseudomonas kairouanensis TaxID=2293832 RepID=A0A4Z0AXA4_9PSED|nr:type VI secretion system-associated FHA domain protein TagH [Pseudomonas kairouanensis]TFY90528.1 type VI secretion system-associated FHA domain protein TagH [Pseudomonas kairouanensis]